MKRWNVFVVVLCVLVLSRESSMAVIKPASIFTDNMVVQQKQVIPVWGTATAGETITVKFMGQEVSSPLAVRYAWAANPTCTLYNNEGLPASSFRSDDGPSVTCGD